MDSRIPSRILCLLIFVLSGNVSTDTASRYVVHRSKVPFQEAVKRCLPGVLTTLATQQEVSAVLGLVSRSHLPEGEFTFWIGLKKAKDQCVVPTLPLRGFRWLDDSQDSQIARWAKEPQDACATVRCVTLQVQLDRVNGSSVSHWGLVPVSCREKTVHRENPLHWFICKLTDRPVPAAATVPAPLEPARPESRPAEPDGPKSTSEVPTRPGSRPTDPQTVRPDGRNATGPHARSEAGTVPCQRPTIPRVRFLILDPNNSTRIHVECWTSVHLDLYCGGSPAAWRLADHSPANFSVLCRACGDGFRKDASGNCVDVDECAAEPCGDTCLNTEGSFRCVCFDRDGTQLDEGSPSCARALDEAGILIPALAAAAALVLLAVVVMVTVKCCLMSRSRKRALEEAETVAMKNKDSPGSFAATGRRGST